MRLDRAEATRRLLGNVHGVFCTLHAGAGVDAVPCIFAADDDGWVGVPVDTVKPKASGPLQRERNLEADPRATLLVEHWDPDDWSRLWWVRARLRLVADAPDEVLERLADRLSTTVPQYADRPFARVMALRVESVSGWAASG